MQDRLKIPSDLWLVWHTVEGLLFPQSLMLRAVTASLYSACQVLIILSNNLFLHHTRAGDSGLLSLNPHSKTHVPVIENDAHRFRV